MKRLKRSIALTVGFMVLATVIALVLTTGHSARQERRAASGTEGACAAETQSSTIPTGPPPDLHWKSIGAIPVPTSDTFGPTRYQGDIWTCFAHSPMGAVLAVYNIPGSLLSPDWLTAAQQELGPGPGRDAFIEVSEGQTYQPLTPGEIAQPIGFQVVSYTPEVATIQLLAATGNGEYQEDARTVTWINGDWKLAMMPDGTTGPDPELVASADGFVLWGNGHG